MAAQRPGYSRQETDLVKDPVAKDEDKIASPAGEGITTATHELDDDRAQRFRDALLSGAGAAGHHSDSESANSLDVDDGALPSQDKYQTTRWELWSFYLYYVGNSGLPTFNFAPIAFQNLLTLAAQQFYASATCTADDTSGCRLPFAGSNRTINSIVLLCNGISFAIQLFLFQFLMPTFKFCGDWYFNADHSNNMLYPKEDRVEKKLMYACRNCTYQEEATNNCVYRHEIVHIPSYNLLIY